MMDHSYCQDNYYNQWKQGKPKHTKTLKDHTSTTGSDGSFEVKYKVAIRVRPVSASEKKTKHKMVIKVIDNHSLIFDPQEPTTDHPKRGGCYCKNSVKRKHKNTLLFFDHVFNSDVTNQTVYNTIMKDVINSLLDGFNCSVFFYGATGTGKTHTMFGQPNCPGIIYLTVQELFDCVDLLRSERDFKINVSYLEVYNDNIHDLLKSSKSLKMRDDGAGGLVVSGLCYPRTDTAQELIEMIKKGNVNRSLHPTGANKESSRSHAVCQIYIKMTKSNVNQENLAKLSMTDLAGSERVSDSNNTGQRYKEAANINKTFLALGNCINSLANGAAFVPYRDSKLTRLLKDTLGGNCTTTMIANVAPTTLTYESTRNTLKYASRAKKIKLRVTKNSFTLDPHIDQCAKRIKELNEKIKQFHGDLFTTDSDKPREKEQIQLAEDLINKWKKELQLKSEPTFLLLRGYLKYENMQKELSVQALRKRRVASVLCSVFSDSEDENIRDVCLKRAHDLETEAESLSREAGEMKKEINGIWNKLQTSEAGLMSLLDDVVLAYPMLDPLAEAVRAEKKLLIHDMQENHLASVVRMQDEEMQAFISFLNEAFGGD